MFVSFPASTSFWGLKMSCLSFSLSLLYKQNNIVNLMITHGDDDHGGGNGDERVIN